MSDGLGVRIHNGNVYIDHHVYEKFFSGIETVALLPRGKEFLILPVFNHASGGRILKMRNARGDRLTNAPDFLRSIGIEDDQDFECRSQWDSAAAALVVSPLVAETEK